VTPSRRRQVHAGAAGHDEIEQVALAQRSLRGAQQAFLESHELHQPESESGIVAQGAKVTEVGCDPLEFERQRAQPRGARRRAHGRHALERLAVGPGEGDGRISGHSRGQRVRREDRQFREAPLDALVHVAEPLLESQDLLSDDGEAEWPGSMMPACTGPTAISWTPSPSTRTKA